MTNADPATLQLRAQARNIHTEAMRDALKTLPPAHTALEGSPVVISRLYQVDDDPTSIPEAKETQVWQITEGRLLPVILSALEPDLRARIALPYAMTAESVFTSGLVLESMRSMKMLEHNNFMTMNIPGAQLVVNWVPDLALGHMEGPEAQAHIDSHFSAYVEAALSNHERVEVLAALSWLLGDLATWGTFERHLGASDGAFPAPRTVSVTL